MSESVVSLDATTAHRHLEQLAEILHDCVEGGASVSFMWPFDRTEASQYWSEVIEALGEGRLRLYAGFVDGSLRGTVQLWLDGPCNQKHRGDIRKMLVHRSARRRGLASALMRHAEDEARGLGLSLVTLDTVTGGPAECLYRGLDWRAAGVIPNYAKWPDGRFCDTTVFYKQIG